MEKRMEKLGLFDIAETLAELNREKLQGVHYIFAGHIGNKPVIITDLDMSEAKLPDGYYWKNKRIKKHRNVPGFFSSYIVMTKEEFGI